MMEPMNHNSQSTMDGGNGVYKEKKNLGIILRNILQRKIKAALPAQGL